MQKRGISPLIATILILGFTIVLAALIMTWGMDIYKSIKEEQTIKAEAELICSSKISPIIKLSCMNNLPYVKVKIENRGEANISSFLIRSRSGDKINIKNSTSGISSFGIVESFALYNIGDKQSEVEFIPRIVVKDQERSCSALKYSVDCSNVNLDNLLGFWKMDEDEGTFVRDYTDKNNGQNNGATWTADGKISGAYVFDGVDDYIGIPSDIYLGDEVTVEAWVKPTAVSGQYVVYGANQNDGSRNFILWIQDSNTIFRTTPYAGPNWQLSTSGLNMQPNTWYYIAATRNNIEGRAVYVDGVLKAADTSSNWAGPTLLSNVIGARAPGTSLFFNGIIDEVRIYNKALSPEEIREHASIR
ncbi:MAG: LamG-like jellyroll fold domain-containing protein [Nanoarchaeota archaeon]